MVIKIKIHEEDCTFCGICETALPDIFQMGESVAKLKKKEVEDDLFEKLKEVIENCPGDAIEFVDTSGT